MSLLLGLSGVISKFEAKNTNMRITQIDLQNIGVFQNLSLSFPEKKEKDKAEIHIFTGENGSGKSTLLHSLVAWGNLFLPPLDKGFIFLDKELLWDNKTSINYIAKKIAKEGASFITIETENNGKIESLSLPKINQKSFEHSLWEYQLNSLGFGTNNVNYRYTFACFGYSGNRTLRNIPIHGVEEAFFHPFENALNFEKSIDPLFFSQSIVQNKVKEALATIQGNKKEALLFGGTIKEIEKVISEITGKEIEFILEANPLKLTLKYNQQNLDFDVLPDGLKSIVSWISDLIMRLSLIPWQDDTPIFERNIILFLDEIEIHLHPAWQRKVLPIVQKLFPNAQIFLSTHSPFVVNSVDGAYIYELKYENGETTIAEPELSSSFNSIDYVLNSVFDVPERQGIAASKEIAEFYEMKNKILKKETIDKNDFLAKAKHLALQDLVFQSKIQFELKQLNKIIGKEEFVI